MHSISSETCLSSTSTMALLLSSTTLLAYVVGPSPGPASSRRGAHAVMQEYKLNNMALPGPLQPLEDQLLVKTSKYDDKTSGGLFVPAAATEKPREGTVIAAGPGKPHEKSGKVIECPVKAGDLVLMSEYAGEKVDYCNEAHLLMPSTEVLGIFEGGNPVASAFKPLADNVLIELAEAATETSSGIALAGSLSEDDSPSGKAVAVGAGKVNADGAVRAAGPPSRERDARAPGRDETRAPPHATPHAASRPLRSPPPSQTIPASVALGDNVLYGKHAGSEVYIEGTKFKVVPASECLAKW